MMRLSIVVLLFLFPVLTLAQGPVKNPSAVIFQKSPDHALLSGYELDILNTMGQVVQTIAVSPLPMPDANGDITVSLNLPSIPLGSYTFRARAMFGSEGSNYSASSEVWQRGPLPPGTPRLLADLSVCSDTYSTPIGIPCPSFGVTQLAPSPAVQCPSWPAMASTNCYYVDRTHALATNTSNLQGYPNKPRLTLPSMTLSAGAYVEIRGTGYTMTGSPTWTMNGTAQAPIWVVGVGDPTFTGANTIVKLRGNHWIVEGLRLVAAKVTASTSFFAFRDSELTGWIGPTATMSIISMDSTQLAPAHDGVFLRLNIHDNGPLSDETGDVDQHGGGMGGWAWNVWILDSIFARNTGDGMQLNSSNGNIDDENDPELGHHFYVGRNTFDENLQNGFWSKDMRDVIVSENLSINHFTNRFGPGACFGSQYGAERIWFLYNTCRDNVSGFQIQSDGQLHGKDIYFIGNVIYDNYVASPPAIPAYGNPSGITTRDMDNRYLINNTIWGNDGGVHCNGLINTLVMVNNIIGGNRNPADSDLLCDGATTPLIHHNVFANNRIAFNHAVETLAAFTARTGWATDSTITPPSFVNLMTRDLRLAADDLVARDTGVVDAVYATFQSLYGLNIAVDRQGLARPQGVTWDRGAYER